METELRERIINASLVLFERHGFHGVTVNQIVETAGISKGGFYTIFPQKMNYCLLSMTFL